MKARYLILMAGVVLFAGNAFAGTDTTRCAHYCARGATCDCDWDADTNTLTVNSGRFGDSAFFGTNYNINVVGDGIEWGINAFIGSQGTVNYSGSDASFGTNAFFDSKGTVNYSGSDASFGINAFFGSKGTVNYSGSDASFGANAFIGSQSDIILSPESIQKVGSNPSFQSTNNIYCTAAPSECDAALAALGVNKTTLAYSAKARIDMESNRQSATNYTASEAAIAATGHGNNSLSFYFR